MSKNLHQYYEKYLPSIRLTDKEIIEAFPEALEIIPSLINELYGRHKVITSIVNDHLAVINKEPDEMSRWFWRRWLELNDGEDLVVINKQIARLKRLLRVAKGIPSPRGMLTQEMIQAAREVPIQSIVDHPYRHGGKTLIGLCPFHEERTPSFRIYVKENRCWCFGCNRGGDVIDVVMLLNDCTFQKAIYLLGEAP